MVTFPPCLVTFPRCLIAISGASHRCTLISLKRLIIGDIAMQQVEKHYMAVEVIAVQFFSIFVLQSVRRFILSVLYNSSWSLASLYFSYCFIRTFQQLLKLSFAILLVQSLFPVVGICEFFVKTIRTPISTNFNLDDTPQAILMSSCEDETSLWWSFRYSS